MPEWSNLQLPASKAKMATMTTFRDPHTISPSKELVSVDKVELLSRHLQDLAAYLHRKSPHELAVRPDAYWLKSRKCWRMSLAAKNYY
jgi:hypothetical protein